MHISHVYDLCVCVCTNTQPNTSQRSRITHPDEPVIVCHLSEGGKFWNAHLQTDPSHLRLSSQHIIFCSFNFPTMSSLSHHPTRPPSLAPSLPPSLRPSLLLSAAVLSSGGREKKRKTHQPQALVDGRAPFCIYSHTHTYTHTWAYYICMKMLIHPSPRQ